MPRTSNGVEMVRADEPEVIRIRGVDRLDPRPPSQQHHDWPEGISTNTSLASAAKLMKVVSGRTIYMVVGAKDFRLLALWKVPGDNSGHRYVRPESDDDYGAWMDAIEAEIERSKQGLPPTLDRHPMSEELLSVIVPDEDGHIERIVP